ncbi:MAG: hypothetical protein FWE03_04430 [Firmicutes bacterium]|nr:hypothetical protein [Bacillota bacterium]
MATKKKQKFFGVLLACIVIFMPITIFSACENLPDECNIRPMYNEYSFHVDNVFGWLRWSPLNNTGHDRWSYNVYVDRHDLNGFVQIVDDPNSGGSRGISLLNLGLTYGENTVVIRDSISGNAGYWDVELVNNNTVWELFNNDYACDFYFFIRHYSFGSRIRWSISRGHYLVYINRHDGHAFEFTEIGTDGFNGIPINVLQLSEGKYTIRIVALGWERYHSDGILTTRHHIVYWTFEYIDGVLDGILVKYI